jgi:hypothetical protein
MLVGFLVLLFSLGLGLLLIRWHQSAVLQYYAKPGVPSRFVVAFTVLVLWAVAAGPAHVPSPL